MRARNNVRLQQRTGSRSLIGHLYCMKARQAYCESTDREMSLLEQFKVCQTNRNGLTGHFAQSVISDMKVELAKPKKDGIEKTQEEHISA